MASVNGRVNLGLVLSLLGSLFSLPLSKRLHLWLGIVFTLLAAIHTWQHRRQFTHYLYRERDATDVSFLHTSPFSSPTKMNLLLQQTQILHYLQGRVRLYSQHLVNNQNLACKIGDYLATIPEIIQFTVNTATGSLLIQYSPENVSRSPLLRGIEQQAVKQYGR